jgi:hypothetical protein
MPKYCISETLRVQFIVDLDKPSNAVEQYMKQFLRTFYAENGIQCMEGSEFSVRLVNEDGTLGYEVDPEEPDSKV